MASTKRRKIPQISASDSEDPNYEETKDVPFFELQKLQESIGTKKFSALMKTQSSSGEDQGHHQQQPASKKAVKRRKVVDPEAPIELSSKRRVPRFMSMTKGQTSQIAKDPRFDERCGHLNKDLFKKSYEFVDKVRAQEKDMIRKKLKKEKDEGRKKGLSRLLSKMDAQEKFQKKEEEKQELVREHLKLERTLQKKGKKPFYYKKAVTKNMALAQSYKKLKTEGGLDKYIEKKRKRNAQKDRRRLPPA